MKHINQTPIILTLIILLLTTYTPISTAQPFSLPDEAFTRIGKGQIIDIEYAPDGMQLAVASITGIWIYDAITFQPLKLLKKEKTYPEHIAYKPDGSLLATYDNCRNIRLWDTQTGTDKPQLGEIDRDRDVLRVSKLFPAFQIAFSADRKTIATVNILKKTIKLWDVETGDEKKTLELEEGQLGLRTCLAFSPDGFLLAAGNEANTLSLWDTISGQHKSDFVGHSSIPISLAFSPDGNTLVSNSPDNTILTWRTGTGELIRLLTGNPSPIDVIKYSPDGGLIAGGCYSGQICLWDANTGAHIKTLKKHTKKVIDLDFSPDLRTMVSASADGRLCVWNLITGELMQTVAEDYVEFISFDISTDGQTIVSPAYRQQTYQWDATTGELHNTLRNLNLRNSIDFALSPDQKTYAWVRNDKFFTIDDLETDGIGKPKFEHTSKVTCVAFSRDGRLIASGTFDKTAHIWDAETAEEKVAIQKHGKSITDIAFSPDGKLIATAGNNRNIYLWHVDTGKRKFVLKRHKSDISSVAFSPDGTLLAFGDKDGNVTIYDADTMKPLKTYKGDHEGIKRVGFTLDGKRLVSLHTKRYGTVSTQSGILYMWDINLRR